MSDAPQDSRWWQASDGKWYPPKDAAPAPGWWLASDGNWYPPVEASGATDHTETDASAEPSAPKARAPRASRSRTAPGKTPPPKAPPVMAPKPKTAQAKPKTTPTKTTPAKTTPAKTTPAKTAQAKPKAATGSRPAEAPKTDIASESKPLPASRLLVREVVAPEEAIARRNLASQADAAVLARSRSLAASRLLTAVAKEVNSTRSESAADPAAGLAAAAATKPSTSTKPAGTKAPAATGPKAPAAKGRPGRAETTDPLLEVKQSALAADIDHIGERLAIFNDRVELLDRNNAVRQSVKGSDITDIVVQKRLTGAVLTIETVDGPVMVAKGLRPEQAEEARSLIMRKTRPAGPVQRDDRPARNQTRPAPAKTPAQNQKRPASTKAAPVASPSGRQAPLPPQRPIDEADVLRKLGDLHRLGILTTEEYENKIELVGSLVRGEITLPA